MYVCVYVCVCLRVYAFFTSGCSARAMVLSTACGRLFSTAGSSARFQAGCSALRAGAPVSSPDFVGRTSRGGPHVLVPPESSVALLAIAVELAGDEVVEESDVLAGQRGPLIGAPEDGCVNFLPRTSACRAAWAAFFRALRSLVRRSEICIRFL